MPNKSNLMVTIAGWVAFVFALWVTVDHLIYMKEHNTTGAGVVLGFVSVF